MKNSLRRAIVPAFLALSLTATPIASAASSESEQGELVPLIAEMVTLSSVAGVENPLAPAPGPPSNREGYGLRGAIEVMLAKQGFLIDRGGAVEAQALKLAKQGYNGEIWLDQRGISNSIYLPHGEGIVTRVSREDLKTIGDWYMNAIPSKASNPKRAGVETWADPGGDVYVGQFFSYHY